jgi:Cell division protein CrgA
VAREGRVSPPSTGTRYTPPIPRTKKHSPRWLPLLFIGLLVAGIAIILLNYLNLLPGGASNWYLLAGLGLICIGFITATQYR